MAGSSRVNGLVGRWAALPRAARWGVVAGAAFALYFLAVEPALDSMNVANVEAERLGDRLERERDLSDTLQNSEASIAIGLTRFGRVELPVASAESVRATQGRITEILVERGVEDFSVSSQRGVPLGRDALPQLLDEDSDQEARRVVFNVQLTAPPWVVSGVLADLERSPGIAAVSSVTLRRVRDEEAGPRVQATLAPEAWVIAEREARR